MDQPGLNSLSNIQAEQAVLASILMENGALYEIDLEKTDFYLERHQWIFEAMQQLSKENDPISVISLSTRLDEKLRLDASGGFAYLTELISHMPSASEIKPNADVLKRYSIRRQIARAGTEITAFPFNCAETPTSDLVALAMSKLEKVHSIERGKEVLIRDAIGEYIPEFENFLREKRQVWGIETGLDLDKYIGGLQEGDYWMVGGRPGKGKTSLGLQIGVNTALRDAATVIFSLEMSKRKLMDRLFSLMGNVSNDKIRRGEITELERRRIMDAVMELEAAPLWIIDESQSTSSIRARIAQMKQRGIPVRVVIIDYLRLLTDTASSEDKRTDDIARATKLLARDFNLTAILITALNRSGEGLQRFKYGGDYDPDVGIICDFDDDRKDEAAVIEIEKNRNGATKDLQMIYRGDVYRWDNFKAKEPENKRPFRMSQIKSPTFTLVGSEN